MIFKTFKIDKNNKSPYSSYYYETTYWHDIGNGISWRKHKHWGEGFLGAEGCLERNGDRSGCLHQTEPFKTISAPMVVEQRHYKKGKYLISAVFSYPNGLSIIDVYFWEIYQLKGKELFGDVERFFGKNGEKEMEKRITQLLN